MKQIADVPRTSSISQHSRTPMTKDLEPIAISDEVVSRRLAKVRALYLLGRSLRDVRVDEPASTENPSPRDRR